LECATTISGDLYTRFKNGSSFTFGFVYQGAHRECITGLQNPHYTVDMIFTGKPKELMDSVIAIERKE